MTAQRRWRAWLTNHLIDCWLGNDRYRRLRLIPGEPRYPEYRIADDARVATDAPIDLTLGLLTSVLNAITFISVLWSVGGDLEVQAFGVSLGLPGYLVIAVTGYSVLLAATMLFVGRRLTPVIEQKNEAEAALRSTACRLRELGEGTALAQPKIEGPNGSDDSPSRVRERKDFANERAKDALVFAATGGIEGIDKE